MIKKSDIQLNELTKKEISLKYVIISAVIALLNSFYYSNFTIMCMLTIIEIGVLLKCFIYSEDCKYFCYYIIFLSLSMESPSYVGTDVFYGFKNFKLFGINVGVLSILPLFIKSIVNGRIVGLMKYNKNVKQFIKGICIMTFLAVFMELVCIMFNDNNIASSINSKAMFIDASYIFIFVLIEVIVIAYVIERNEKKTMEIKQSLHGIIISLAITLLASLIFKNYGNRGGLNSLQVSNIVMLLICVIILPLYKKYSKYEKMLLLITGSTITILSLLYNTNGKMIIIIALVPLMSIILLVRSGKTAKTVFMVACLPFLIYILVNVIIPVMSGNSFLFSVKMEQATSMLSFWKSGWLSSLPDSPKMRIAEFLNIAYEYLKQPWFLLTGKGYIGTIKDHLLMFGVIDKFSFSTWELTNELYYNMHETLNVLFLTNGLMGLLFYIQMIKIIFKNFHKSQWLMIGGFWFILFYGYSITISIFGVTALIIGLFDLDSSENLTINQTTLNDNKIKN